MFTLADAGLRPLARRMSIILFCQGKRRHASEGASRAAMRSLVRRDLHRPDQGALHVYRCPRCLTWHVGHSSRGISSSAIVVRTA
jgi:hypothetical protein